MTYQYQNPVRTIRVNDVEWNALQDLATVLGYTSRHAYLRSLFVKVISENHKVLETIAPEYQETLESIAN